MHFHYLCCHGFDVYFQCACVLSCALGYVRVCVCVRERVPETALSARYAMMLHVGSGFLLKTLIG